jgi:Protein of unknown function (DUF1592)/Protein of unknown function (DUF1588)/Protein of unknown function (DUF1595)/Protein of unknown function (DUF1587)/Protein of unknown function (DUF1585)/Cellulose binding domain
MCRSKALLALAKTVAFPVACAAVFLAPSCALKPDGAHQAGGTGCPDDLAYFKTELWEPLMMEVCVECHNESGLAKNSGMVLTPGDSPEAVSANLETVRRVAREKVGGVSVLVLKPSGKYPGGHTGGELVKEGTALYDVLRTFAARANGEPGACSAADGGAEGPPGFVARKLRRLTRFEYDNTLADLFGVPSTWGQSLPPDDVVDGFDNNAASLAVGALFADKAREAAEDIVGQVGADLTPLVSCATSVTGAEADKCAQGFIDSFGARALRRPLEPAEKERYVALYAVIAADEGFAEGIRAVLTAMLQSPYFLYRLELGGLPENGTVTLTDFEIASELSYLLVGSMPDAELTARANAGTLHAPADIAAQAERLLASPGSRRMLDHFVGQWLDLDRLLQVPKDEMLYPDFTPDIRTAMRAETAEFFDSLVHGGGKLPELFGADYSFMSDGLAMFYGLDTGAGPASPSGLPRYALGPNRRGVLTHGSILATQAKNNSSAPIHRGKLVRERLLCQKLPPPPAGLNVQLPPVDPKLSNRERFTAHDQNDACSSCHKLMDPIGFGFEAFDGVGHFQTVDHGKPVLTSGEILDSPHTSGKFDGVLELESRLAGSEDVQKCFTLQWARFAYGESGDANEAADVVRNLAAFQAAEYRIDRLLVGLTQSTRFTMRAADPASMPSSNVPPSPDGGTPMMTPGKDAGRPIESMDAGAIPTPGFQVDRQRNADWSTGYCEQVTVTNTGTSAADWSITIAIDGTLTQNWNSTMAPTSNGMFQVTGADSNRHLEAGANTGFGFCASK